MDDYTVKNKQWLKVVGIFSVISILALVFVFSLAKSVSLEIDGDAKDYSTYAGTVEGFLKKEGIELSDKGYINYPLDARLEDDMQLVIKKPKHFTIEVGEKQDELISPHDTVSLILKDLDIKLGSLDYTEPSLDEKVRDGDTIKLFRVEEKIEDIEKPIPYETVTRPNHNLDKGVTNLVQKGENGKKLEKIKKKFINGELVATNIIEEKVIKSPVTEMKEEGSRQLLATSRGNRNFKKSLIMNASAYDLSFKSTGKRPGDRGYGITASGTKARPGVVAVDPRVIPLGSKLYVESLDSTKDYGFATAEDKGGAIKGHKIDLFFESSTDVRNFGRRNVKVYILD